MRTVALLFVLALSACTSGINMTSVDYGNLLHDNNSKVWVVNKLVYDKVNTSGVGFPNKDLMIFHEDGTVQITPVKGLGKQRPKTGRYYLDSEDKEIEFYFDNQETWLMKMNYLTEDSVYMSPRGKSKAQFELQIVPLPVL